MTRQFTVLMIQAVPEVDRRRINYSGRGGRMGGTMFQKLSDRKWEGRKMNFYDKKIRRIISIIIIGIVAAMIITMVVPYIV